MRHRLSACIVWLYCASSSTMWWFLYNFFCLVCWKKKKLIRRNLAYGRVSGTACSVCMCINAGFIASDLVWLHEPMLGHWDVGLGRGNRWVCPRFSVTFEPRQVAVGTWQEVKGEAMPVNEARTPVWSRGLYGRTEVDDGLKWMWLWWRGVTLPTQEMRWAFVWAVWQNGLEVLVCILALRKLCVWLAWPLPSGSASGPLRKLNEHIWL